MNSKDLDLSKEIELFFNEPGISIELEYDDGYIRSFGSITEFHWRYPSPIEPSVALESDVLSTGWTYPINRIKSFKIGP